MFDWVMNTHLKTISVTYSYKTRYRHRVVFNIKTSHLICIVNQMTGFYMKYITGQKWLKVISNWQNALKTLD